MSSSAISRARAFLTPAAPSFLIVVMVVVALMFSWRHAMPPNSFKAFYCAGWAIDHHADPYRVEPLRECEHRVAPAALPSYAVEPAPLPGYALVPFALAARVPYVVAERGFVLLSLAALFFTGLGLAALTRTSAVVCTLVMLGLWYLNVQYGELAALAAAGIVLTAYALRCNRPWIAGIGAALVAIEPHVALPLWLSLALFAPRTRGALAVFGFALVALGFAAGGVTQTVTYFSHVLPLQALAEVHANDQFSLTHQLALIGVPDRVALLLGSASYVVMLAVGCAVAARLAKTEEAPEYLALAPPAFALFGGTFVHDVQFIAALPLAIVELARRRDALPFAGTLLLCIAWGSGQGLFGLLMSACSALSVVSFVSLQSPRRVVSEMSAFVLLVLAVWVNHYEAPAATLHATVRVVDASAWSPTGWQAYLDASPGRSHPQLFDFLRKLPTWMGLVIVLAGALRRVSPSVPGAPATSVIFAMVQPTAFKDDPPPPASSQRHL